MRARPRPAGPTTTSTHTRTHTNSVPGSWQQQATGAHPFAVLAAPCCHQRQQPTGQASVGDELAAGVRVSQHCIVCHQRKAHPTGVVTAGTRNNNRDNRTRGAAHKTTRYAQAPSEKSFKADTGTAACWGGGGLCAQHAAPQLQERRVNSWSQGLHFFLYFFLYFSPLCFWR